MKIQKKILPQYFKDVVAGNKNFELRKDEDNIQPGDILELREWDGSNYTGGYARCKVTYVLRNCPFYGLMKGFCIIGFEKLACAQAENNNEKKNKRALKIELAEMLNGKELGDDTFDCRKFAKENGLVFVTGYSDDLMEFEGAIYDEGGCWNGGDVYFDKNGVAQDGEHLKNKITAVWYGKVGASPVGYDGFKTDDGELFAWGYITDIPHETFDIYEDGDPYCRGIVFALEDVQ